MHGGGAAGGGGGMDSLVPQTGKGTAFIGIGLFVGLFWGIRKHPKMMFGAFGCATLIMALAGFPDIMAHPVIGFILMGVGALWGMSGGDEHNDKIRADMHARMAAKREAETK